MKDSLFSKPAVFLGGLALIVTLNGCTSHPIKQPDMNEQKYAELLKAAKIGSEVDEGDKYWLKEEDGWTMHSKNGLMVEGEDAEIPLELFHAVKNGATIYRDGIPGNTPEINIDR